MIFAAGDKPALTELKQTLAQTLPDAPEPRKGLNTKRKRTLTKFLGFPEGQESSSGVDTDHKLWKGQIPNVQHKAIDKQIRERNESEKRHQGHDGDDESDGEAEQSLLTNVAGPMAPPPPLIQGTVRSCALGNILNQSHQLERHCDNGSDSDASNAGSLSKRAKVSYQTILCIHSSFMLFGNNRKTITFY